jgi:branched-chain amino acid transport system substrate-binding protein
MKRMFEGGYLLMSRNLRRLLSGVAPFMVGLVVLLQGCSPAAKEAVTVGVIVPTTGSISVWGVNSERGIRLAAKQINAAGGIDGAELRLLVEDSECKPEKAVAALRRMISQGVQVVLGNICSSNVLAMAPIAEESKVVLFSTGASNPAISDAGDFIFRSWPSDRIQGDLTAEYASRNGFKNVAILYVDNAYGQGLEGEFRKHFQELGGTIALTPSETYAEGDDDFHAQLDRIQGSGADGLYLAAYTREFPLILRQLREAGSEIPVIASETFDDPRTIQQAGPAADGVVFPSPAAFDETTPQGKEFAQAFEAEYGEPPGVTADTAFDAMKIVADALSGGARTGSAIKDYLYGLSDYPGVAGTVRFDANGDAQKPIRFYRVADGVAAPIG